MNKLKKMIAGATLMAMVGSSSNCLNAQEYVSELAGYGYQQSCSAPAYTPAIALGAIALVAIVAVALASSGHVHGHAH